MSKHPTGLESIERRLRSHDQRLKKLLAWRSGVLAALKSLEAEDVPRGKAMDGTPDPRTLVYERDALDREIRFHETLTAFGRDRQALDLLDQLAHDPALAHEAAPDPRAFAEARGISLPRNMAVQVKVAAGRVSVQLDYNDPAHAATLTFP